jgi:predicted AAA+ superfamily ATPase
MDYVPRQLTERVVTSLSDTPVVVLQGVRQCGKSTLAREITRRQHPASYLTLDDPSVLLRAQEDPMTFINGLEGPVVLDEVQRALGLFVCITLSVDRDRRPGRFLLTASAQTEMLPHVADELVGRVAFTTLWPFSRGELAGTAKDFITAAFKPGRLERTGGRATRRELLRSAQVGGFPEAVARRSPRRADWFASYLATSLERSIRDVADIDGLAQMPRLLALLAARTGGLVNYADLARSLRLPETTVRRYTAYLEMVAVVQRLPAWATNVSVRVAKAPKLHLVDSGLLAHLLDLDDARLATQPELGGPLLETFVVNELFRQQSFSATRCTLSHFRTRSAGEVDVVLEGPGGAIVGIEVKASDTVASADARGLRTLRDEAEERFVRGLVLHTGEHWLSLGDRIEAAPICAVWE